MHVASFLENTNGVANEVRVAGVPIVVFGMKDVFGRNRPVRLVYRARLSEVFLVEYQLDAAAVLPDDPLAHLLLRRVFDDDESLDRVDVERPETVDGLFQEIESVVGRDAD